MDKKQSTITTAQAGQRLDIFCVSLFPHHSRSTLQKAIKAGQIIVNNKTVKPNYVIKTSDTITVPPLLYKERVGVRSTNKQELSLPILYQDKDIIAINKPAGILVHPAPNSTESTVIDWFKQNYPSGHNYVHRLDRDTSGVLLLTKTQTAYKHLKAKFKKHTVKKEYLALVHGVPKTDDGRINQPIARSHRNPARRTIDSNGKLAITEWQLEQKLGTKYSLLRVFPFTGRTHQIRVHLHFMGHPIVGDPLYNFKRQKTPGVSTQLLHADKITFKLPTGKTKTITAPLPKYFQTVMTSIQT